MKKSVEKTPVKRKGVVKRVMMQYVFFAWPALRTYCSMWVAYWNRDKKKKKEKIIIIED